MRVCVREKGGREEDERRRRERACKKNIKEGEKCEGRKEKGCEIDCVRELCAVKTAHVQ